MAGDGAGAGRVFHHAFGKYAIHQRVYCFYNFRETVSDYLFFYMSELFQKEMDKEVSVASMTKMVAQIIILEQIEAGKIKWTDKVTASANASGMGGSQIYLTTGEEMTVEDMMKGISMASANDVVVVKKQSQVIGEEITI